VKVKHSFLQNDIVCLKSYAIPVTGTKGVFTPKVLPNLYKVVNVTDFSVDITVKCLKTGHLIHTVAKDLKMIDPSYLLPTLGEVELWDPSLLEEWKSISRPGLIEETFSILPHSNLSNQTSVTTASSLDHINIPPPQTFVDQDNTDPLYENLDILPTFIPVVPDEFIDGIPNNPTGQDDIDNLIQTNPKADHNFTWKSCLKPKGKNKESKKAVRFT